MQRSSPAAGTGARLSAAIAVDECVLGPTIPPPSVRDRDIAMVFQNYVRGEIKDLHRRLKTTTVYVTHDQVEAMTMAHRIVVMNAGRVEQIGTPIELFDRPANMFVAGFIGSPAMNFVPGPMLGEGSDSIVGVRPEHWDIADGGLQVTVTSVDPMGSDTQIAGAAGETEIVALFHRRVAAQPGDVLSLRPVQRHLFRAADGIRYEAGQGAPASGPARAAS
jgi:multiple sugar transport system ATP-binding protein